MSYQEVLARSLAVMTSVCSLKTTMAAPVEVSVAAVASIQSELESLSRGFDRPFLDLPTGFTGGTLSCCSPDQVKLARDTVNCHRWFGQTPARYFFKVSALRQTTSSGAFPDGSV